MEKWEALKDAGELRRFMGLVNYLGAYVEGIKEGHMEKLLSKDVPWEWGKDQQEAFIKLKKKIASLPTLTMYHPDLAKRLETDASDYGIGGVLYQKERDELWKLLGFIAKTLLAHQKNWPTHNKKMFTLIETLTKWRHYILGSKISVNTDNRTVQTMLSQKGIGSMKRSRWQEVLTDYNIEFKHILGRKNMVADIMSRWKMEKDKNTMAGHTTSAGIWTQLPTTDDTHE